MGTPAIAGAIATSTDADWYKVVVTRSGTLGISVAINGVTDLDWYLYAEGNTTTGVARGFTTQNPEAGSFAATAGTYYVKVVGYRGALSTYSLAVTAP